jgi:two-component system phosphate regulon response regulator PhoB
LAVTFRRKFAELLHLPFTKSSTNAPETFTNPQTALAFIRAVDMQTKRPTRLLLVSEDAEVRAGIREALSPLCCEMEEVASAREAIAAAERERPDLMIADMVLRDATGTALCRFVREHPDLSRLPVVLLSAFKEEMDRILAFEVGVDDFIPSPYYGRELLSRARAILRRTRTACEANSARSTEGPVRLDFDGTRVEVFGKDIDLTPKEFRILAVLVQNDRRVLSRDRIINEVWDRAITEPRVVDAHIKAIRRKLGSLSNSIETVRGVGFRYTPQRDGQEADQSDEPDSPSLGCTG